MLPELQGLRAVIGFQDLGAPRAAKYTVRIGVSV